MGWFNGGVLSLTITSVVSKTLKKSKLRSSVTNDQFALVKDFTHDGVVEWGSVIVDNYERSVLVIVNDNTPPLDHPILSKTLKKSKLKKKTKKTFFFIKTK